MALWGSRSLMSFWMLQTTFWSSQFLYFQSTKPSDYCQSLTNHKHFRAFALLRSDALPSSVIDVNIKGFLFINTSAHMTSCHSECATSHLYCIFFRSLHDPQSIIKEHQAEIMTCLSFSWQTVRVLLCTQPNYVWLL